jgi:hypothetical protein
MPKRDAQFPTSLFQSDKGISASPSCFRTIPTTDFAPGDIFPYIRLSFVNILPLPCGVARQTSQYKLSMNPTKSITLMHKLQLQTIYQKEKTKLILI